MTFLSGKAQTIDYQPTGISAGGLDISPRSGVTTESSDRLGTVSGLGSSFNTQGDLLGGLRDTVAPGYNSLLQSRLTALGNQQASALSNLKQNLAARRVLGSSFGNDALNRANLDYAQQRDATIADNFLQSLNANAQLLNQQYSAYQNAYNSKLSDLNFTAQLAANLQNNANSALADVAKAQAVANTAAAGQQANFFGTVVGSAAGLGGNLLKPAPPTIS